MTRSCAACHDEYPSGREAEQAALRFPFILRPRSRTRGCQRSAKSGRDCLCLYCGEGIRRSCARSSEAEAYARCHGGRDDDVRIVKVEPRRPRYDFGPSGERLREAFEKRLDTREPEAEER